MSWKEEKHPPLNCKSPCGCSLRCRNSCWRLWQLPKCGDGRVSSSFASCCPGSQLRQPSIGSRVHSDPRGLTHPGEPSPPRDCHVFTQPRLLAVPDTSQSFRSSCSAHGMILPVAYSLCSALLKLNKIQNPLSSFVIAETPHFCLFMGVVNSLS